MPRGRNSKKSRELQSNKRAQNYIPKSKRLEPRKTTEKLDINEVPATKKSNIVDAIVESQTPTEITPKVTSSKVDADEQIEDFILEVHGNEF